MDELNTNNEAIDMNNPKSHVMDSETAKGEILDAQSNKNQVMPMSLSSLENVPEKRRGSSHLKRSLDKLPLEIMLDVPFTLVFEVGRNMITIKDLMELQEGSFIDLKNVSVDSIDVLINGKMMAQAEPIAMQPYYGMRFCEILPLTSFEEEEFKSE